MADWIPVICEFVAGFLLLLGVIYKTDKDNEKKHVAQMAEMKGLFQQSNADQEQRFQKQSMEIKAELSRYEAVNDQKIATLTKQVEKHNEVIERTYKLEKDVAVMKVKMGISGGNSEKE